MPELSKTFGGDGLAIEVDGQLHRLWTKAVGTPDYDKEEWKAFECLLFQLFKDRRDRGWKTVQNNVSWDEIPRPKAGIEYRITPAEYGYTTRLLYRVDERPPSLDDSPATPERKKPAVFELDAADFRTAMIGLAQAQAGPRLNSASEDITKLLGRMGEVLLAGLSEGHTDE